MDYVSDLQSLIVLSFANAPEAIMFSVGWQAVHRTTSASSNEVITSLVNGLLAHSYFNISFMSLEVAIRIGQ